MGRLALDKVGLFRVFSLSEVWTFLWTFDTNQNKICTYISLCPVRVYLHAYLAVTILDLIYDLSYILSVIDKVD